MPPKQETALVPYAKPMSPWLAGLIGFIIGALAVSAWSIESKLAETRSTAPAPIATTAPAVGTSSASTASNGLISVMDQPAGPDVIVDSVSIDARNVWVAVEDITNSGTLGNVLGATLVSGPTGRIDVPLLRATSPGTTYAVVLYRDNGDKTFTIGQDSLYVDFTSGDRVVALFKTRL